MKFLLIFLIIAYVFSCSSNNGSTKQETVNTNLKDSIIASIEFSKRVVNFGILSHDTTVHAIFYIRNTSLENLIIKEVDPECSCTGYILDNNKILPGDSTKLVVNFNTKGKIEGLQRKAIVIVSNTINEYNTLFIRCIIRSKPPHKQ